MLQRIVDGALAVAKESVKTFTYESLNNIVRFINGVSALLLALIPGKSSILEGMHGWELRPTLRGPKLPRWMENGVSSFNQFIHELSVNSDSFSSGDDLSEDEGFDDSMPPISPVSSRLSRASSFYRRDKRVTRLIKYLLSWLMWPMTLAIGLLLHICRSLFSRRPGNAHGSIAMEQLSSGVCRKKANIVKDHIVHRTTDRRRGVVEDLQLGIEIFIEATFDIIHKAVHLLLSPKEIFGMISRWFSPDRNINKEDPAEVGVSVPTATLGEDDPSLTELRTTHRQPLNTDARTCQDVIRECGYPYEAIQVVTEDGYVLPLERIPRRDSQKVAYLQHGVLDSSLGWVSNGVVGSPAFAAFDQGYDVFLGNFRGLVSREHIDKNISSRNYWRYSINQHGLQDVPAIIEKIHEIKTTELKARGLPGTEDETTDQPYKMCAICHSLGGAAILMYIVTRRMEAKPHRLSRLVLLSPAGFHEDSTFLFSLVEYFFLLFAPVIAVFMPGIYIPTKFFRMLVNKLARDFHNYPALGGLVQTLMSYVFGGDTSNWVGALGLPHYNMYDMPGISVYVAVHLAQMKRAKKFIMYDFGSEAANMEAYGSPHPLDLGQHYNLIDIPVDLVGGKMDHIIRPSMVRKHYKVMRRAGVEVSYNEYEYGHLDFTFSHREELLAYVMSRLLMVGPPRKDSDPLRRSRRSQPRFHEPQENSEST